MLFYFLTPLRNPNYVPYAHALKHPFTFWRNRAKECWHSVTPTAPYPVFFNEHIHNWCHHSTTLNVPYLSTTWPIIFSFAIWTLLLARNAKISRNENSTPNSLHHTVIHHATEFYHYAVSKSPQSKKHSPLITWNPQLHFLSNLTLMVVPKVATV